MVFREAVRKRPGMYLGDPRNGQAANNAILELVGNVIDQFLAGRATQVSVTIDGIEIEVSDDGPGLPFGASAKHDISNSQAEFDLEHPHFDATSKGHAPHIHAASFSMGLAAVNPVCDSLEVTSDDGQRCWQKSYKQGLAVSELSKHATSGTSGTSFKLRLSSDLIGQPNVAALSDTFEMQAYLYPNLQLNFNDKTFVARDGLLSLARQISAGEANDPLYFYCNDIFNDIHIQAALLGRKDGEGVLRSWVNGQESRYGGSHIEGLRRALKSFGWHPEVSLLNITMHDPKFAGPTKDMLLSRAICDKVEVVMRDAIAAANLPLG